jgi:hypothetical protein
MQLRPFDLAQRTLTMSPPILSAPVAQRSLVDSELPGHLRDRLPGFFAELKTELVIHRRATQLLGDVVPPKGLYLPEVGVGESATDQEHA